MMFILKIRKIGFKIIELVIVLNQRAAIEQSKKDVEREGARR